MRRVWLSLPKKRGGCGFFWVEKWAEACFVEKPHPPQNLHVFIFCGGCGFAEGVARRFLKIFAHFSAQKTRRVCQRFCRSEGYCPKNAEGVAFFGRNVFAGQGVNLPIFTIYY